MSAATKGKRRVVAAVGAGLVAAAVWIGAAPAATKDLALVGTGPPLRSSSLPGHAKAQANCTACHSAEYLPYQPPNAARPYWDAMVKRMKTVFNAPIDDADMPAIVDDLVRTYGNEQP